jgi:hypothetical protein
MLHDPTPTTFDVKLLFIDIEDERPRDAQEV